MNSKAPTFPDCMHARQNGAVFIKIVLLLGTWHSYEIRETWKCNATEGNQDLPGATPFKPCEYKWGKTRQQQTLDSKPMSLLREGASRATL